MTTTRPIVPRVNGDSSVGVPDKHWGKSYIDEGHFDSVKLNGGDVGEYLAESTGFGIVSGCEPSISGLTVTVGAGVVHLADGTRKELSATNITLDNADSTNPRIDLVYITNAGVVAKITGTASASPSAPVLPSGGISVCNVTVAAGATTGTITDSRDFALVTNKNVMTVKEGRFEKLVAEDVILSGINQPIIVCDSVADMKANTAINSGMCVITLGYYVPGDGGGATYYVVPRDSESEDLGSVIYLTNNLTAKYFVDKNRVINVRQFGAKGDCSDASDAFIDAFTFAVKVGGAIYVPHGNYKITKDLPSLTSGMSIYGDRYGYKTDAMDGTVIVDVRTSGNPLLNFAAGSDLGGVISDIDFEAAAIASKCINNESEGWDYLYENLRFVNYQGTTLKSAAVGARLCNVTFISCGGLINGTPEYALETSEKSTMHLMNSLHFEHCRYVMKIRGFAHSLDNSYVEMSSYKITADEHAPIDVVIKSGNACALRMSNSTFIALPSEAMASTGNAVFFINATADNGMVDTGINEHLIIENCSLTQGDQGLSDITWSYRQGIAFLKANGIWVGLRDCSLSSLINYDFAININGVGVVQGCYFGSIPSASILVMYVGQGYVSACLFATQGSGSISRAIYASYNKVISTGCAKTIGGVWSELVRSDEGTAATYYA